MRLDNQYAKNDTVTWRFHCVRKPDLDNLYLEIDNGLRNSYEKPAVISAEDGELGLAYHFPKRGFFDIHVMLGKRWLMTFTAEVGRG